MVEPIGLLNSTNVSNDWNSSITVDDVPSMSNDDAAWILTCTFVIFTMQTGFAMLECGFVTSKNVANIMIKNVVDVSIGGIGYWLFGHALGFGHKSNAFVSYSEFGFAPGNIEHSGGNNVQYFFHLAFSSTATTIVSGAVAERMTLHAYMIFAFLNNIIYAIPAHWVWHPNGFLNKMGFYDLAGASVVHCGGGTSALIAAAMLGPRMNRFQKTQNTEFQMSSPVTALTGMFMLWWAWLAFNCGSTKSVGDPGWKITSYVAVATFNGGIGGGCTGLAVSMVVNRGKISINHVITSVLGGLVSITGIAAVTSPRAAILISSAGAMLAIAVLELLNKVIRIDDPVGAIPAHLCAGLWGIVCIGLFAEGNSLDPKLENMKGLIVSGEAHQILIQLLGAACIIAWSATVTAIMLFLIKCTIGIRMTVEEEALGADWCLHGLQTERLATKLDSSIQVMNKEELEALIRSAMCGKKSKSTIGEQASRETTSRHRIFAVDRDPDEQQRVDDGTLRSDIIESIAHIKSELSESKDQCRTHLSGAVIARVTGTSSRSNIGSPEDHPQTLPNGIHCNFGMISPDLEVPGEPSMTKTSMRF